MKEIKFRGLDKRGVWHYGYFWRNQLGYCFIKEKFEDFEVIPETVGQFTGLKDKNGKEIYDGDIVKTSNKEEYIENIESEILYLIKYCQGSYCWEELDGSLIFSMDELMIQENNFCYVELMGNKFENEERVK